MTVSPTMLGVGTGVASALVLGFGTSKITDGIAERNPNGSSADGKSRLAQVGMGALAVGAIVGGVVASSRGNASLGAALVGGGVGGVLGVTGAGIAFTIRHGVGVQTKANDVFSNYNRDFDDVLDLYPGWRTPENVRRERHQHEDSRGNTYYTYSYHSISRLTDKANVNRDGVVTRPELFNALASYDADGNGRLQGNERSRMEREVGEQSWYGSWF